MLGSNYTLDDEEEQAYGTDDVHTASNPYCGDINCWCHTDVAYHADVTELSGSADEEVYQKALSFYGIS